MLLILFFCFISWVISYPIDLLPYTNDTINYTSSIQSSSLSSSQITTEYNLKDDILDTTKSTLIAKNDSSLETVLRNENEILGRSDEIMLKSTFVDPTFEATENTKIPDDTNISEKATFSSVDLYSVSTSSTNSTITTNNTTENIKEKDFIDNIPITENSENFGITNLNLVIGQKSDINDKIMDKIESKINTSTNTEATKSIEESLDSSKQITPSLWPTNNTNLNLELPSLELSTLLL